MRNRYIGSQEKRVNRNKRIALFPVCRFSSYCCVKYAVVIRNRCLSLFRFSGVYDRCTLWTLWFQGFRDGAMLRLTAILAV